MLVMILELRWHMVVVFQTMLQLNQHTFFLFLLLQDTRREWTPTRAHVPQAL